MAAPWSAGAQARILGRIHGQQTVNVLHFATNTVINDPQALATLLTALATAILACVVENLAAFTIDWKVTGVDARQIKPAVSDEVFVAAAEGTEGTQGPASVSFIASLVHLRTGGGGRSGRGRIFLPPGSEFNTTDSVYTPAAITSLNDMLLCIAGKFIGAGATEPWRLGVLSRKTMGKPPDPANFDNAFREVISTDVAANPAVMGSRKVGRGS